MRHLLIDGRILPPSIVAYLISFCNIAYTCFPHSLFPSCFKLHGILVKRDTQGQIVFLGGDGTDGTESLSPRTSPQIVISSVLSAENAVLTNDLNKPFPALAQAPSRHRRNYVKLLNLTDLCSYFDLFLLITQFYRVGILKTFLKFFILG